MSQTKDHGCSSGSKQLTLYGTDAVELPVKALPDKRRVQIEAENYSVGDFHRKTGIINLSKDPFPGDYDQYVGRPRTLTSVHGGVTIKNNTLGQYGNPFGKANLTDTERTEVLLQYLQMLLENPSLIAKVRANLKCQRLACFCAPLRCHADILAVVANTDVEAELLRQPLTDFIETGRLFIPGITKREHVMMTGKKRKLKEMEEREDEVESQPEDAALLLPLNTEYNETEYNVIQYSRGEVCKFVDTMWMCDKRGGSYIMSLKILIHKNQHWGLSDHKFTSAVANLLTMYSLRLVDKVYVFVWKHFVPEHSLGGGGGGGLDFVLVSSDVMPARAVKYGVRSAVSRVTMFLQEVLGARLDHILVIPHLLKRLTV